MGFCCPSSIGGSAPRSRTPADPGGRRYRFGFQVGPPLAGGGPPDGGRSSEASGAGWRGCFMSNGGRVFGSQLGPKPLALKRYASRPLVPAPFASISTSCSPARLGEQYDSR